jgi:hypothetical protein
MSSSDPEKIKRLIAAAKESYNKMLAQTESAEAKTSTATKAVKKEKPVEKKKSALEGDVDAPVLKKSKPTPIEEEKKKPAPVASKKSAPPAKKESKPIAEVDAMDIDDGDDKEEEPVKKPRRRKVPREVLSKKIKQKLKKHVEDDQDSASGSECEEDMDCKGKAVLDEATADKLFEAAIAEQDARRLTAKQQLEKIEATWVSPDELEFEDKVRPALNSAHFPRIAKFTDKYETVSDDTDDEDDEDWVDDEEGDEDDEDSEEEEEDEDSEEEEEDESEIETEEEEEEQKAPVRKTKSTK